MTKCENCASAPIKVEIVPKHDASILGAPFGVFLCESVKIEKCTSCGAVLNTAIPDPEGLLYAVGFARALHPRKLTGSEIKFLRNVMGFKAKQLADELGITAEHLSRCEHGHIPLSLTTEKLLRLLAILRPGFSREATQPEVREKVQAIVEGAVRDLVKAMSSFQIAASWDAAKPLEFHFHRRTDALKKGADPDDDNGKWKPEPDTRRLEVR